MWDRFEQCVEVLGSSAPGLIAALFYALVSGSMSFVNKVVLTTFSFDYPDVIMLLQITLTSFILELLRLLKWCDIPAWTFERGKEFLFPSLCFALHTTLALAALSGLSIPMYNVLRRLLPLVNLLTARYLLHKTPSTKIIFAVCVIVSGTVFASLGDLRFDLASYTNALLSVLAQATYLTYVQRTGVENSLTALQVLHLNSINCIPMLFIYTLINGNLREALSFTLAYSDFNFIYSLLCTVGLGCVLNYSLFLCATTNSALTTSLVGVIKGVVTTIIGFFTFGGQPLTTFTLVGVTLNALGGMFYGYGKYEEKRGLVTKLVKKTNSLGKRGDGGFVAVNISAGIAEK